MVKYAVPQDRYRDKSSTVEKAYNIQILLPDITKIPITKLFKIDKAIKRYKNNNFK